jgi:hypothetical protein
MGAMNKDETHQALLERHGAFWTRHPVAEPILRVRPHRPLGWGGHFGRYVRPFGEGELIEPERMTFEPDEPAALVDGPLFCGLQLPGVCWTEALLGCPVRMETGGAWAERFLFGPDDVRRVLDRARAGQPSPWLKRFREAVSAFAEMAKGRFPLVQPLMRGPLDMMASALGHEQTVEAFLDYPELAGALLGRCAGLFIEMAAEFLSLAPPFLGGGVTFGLWTPGGPIRTQLDNAVLVSPDMYREHCLPHDARVFASFDPVVLHVHSGCLHIVDHLLSARDLDAIQISIDHPGGPLAGEIMPILEKIQEKKPLIVTGPVTEAELEGLLSLPPAGVALDLQKVEETS